MNKGSYNKVVLVGHLGDDPDLKFTTSGSAVVNLSLATNESWKSADGEIKEKTEWHRVVVFGKRAEIAGEWLKKGQMLLVEGKLQTRCWEPEDGSAKRYSTEVICENFIMLGKKGDQPASAASNSSAKESEQDDDLPF